MVLSLLTSIVFVFDNIMYTKSLKKQAKNKFFFLNYTALFNQNAVTEEIEIAGKMRLKICYYLGFKLKHSTVL